MTGKQVESTVALGVVALGVGLGVAGCGWRTTSTAGPFVRDIAVDARAVRITACEIVMAREASLVTVRPVPGGPGSRVGGGDVALEDGECTTSTTPREAR